MQEVGGYFGFEQLISNEYYKDLISLNNARNALLYLLKTRNIRKLYIPHYLCNSISDVCIKNGYKIEYYRIDSNFLPIFNNTLYNDEYIYLVNYYGQLTNEKVYSLVQKHRKIIVDNTHAFFQKPIDGVDTLYSCRKFFGVPDGAYLSTNKNIMGELPVDVSSERMKHILGRYEGTASDYYDSFQRNEDFLANEPIKRMSILTHNILGAIDYDRVCRIREVNYAYLENELGARNELKLESPKGGFAYPFYVENGMKIRRALANNKIYIPTLWPNVLSEMPEDSNEYRYAANILPLPCDQRYGLEDMKVVIKKLRFLLTL